MRDNESNLSTYRVCQADESNLGERTPDSFNRVDAVSLDVASQRLV